MIAVTELDATEACDTLPVESVAVTVKLYEVPTVRPDTTAVGAAAVPPNATVAPDAAGTIPTEYVYGAVPLVGGLNVKFAFAPVTAVATTEDAAINADSRRQPGPSVHVYSANPATW